MTDNVLTEEQIQEMLTELEGWTFTEGRLRCAYTFKDFVQALDFVNRIGEVAEEVQHHPDMLLTYGKVTVTLISHDAGGITERDTEMARRINELYGQ